MNNLSYQFEQAVMSLDRLEVKKLVAKALTGMTPMEFVEQVIVSSLTRIGLAWEKGEAALSQVYMGGRICEELVDGLLLPGGQRCKDQPPIAIVSLNDYHLLGKRIVYSVLRASGFELKDYGRATVEEILIKAREDCIQALLISTLMLNSALHVRDLVDSFKASGMNVKVVVGGAPFRFDDKLWQEVGANAMGATASEAPEIINNILERRL